MGNLTEEEKKARMREYGRKYYQENKERITAYRAAHKEEINAQKAEYYAAHKEKRAAYYQENKEKIIARSAEYYAAHKEKRAAYDAAYRTENKDKIAAQRAEYRAAHKEETSVYNAAYRAAHKEEIAAKRAAYRTTTHGRAVEMASSYKSIDKKKGFDTSENIDAAWIEENVFNGQRCVYCGESDYLKLGVDRINNALGHVPENCVPCCWDCNNERKNKFSFEEFVEYKKAALQ